MMLCYYMFQQMNIFFIKSSRGNGPMKLRQPFTFRETVPTPQEYILADEAQLSLLCCFVL